MSEDVTEKSITMLIESYPRLGFKAFASMVADGTPGICVTRLHPNYVKEKYGITGLKLYWLSGGRGEEVISPKTMIPLLKALKQEAREKKVYVFLDGLEYLLLWNDTQRLLSALHDIDQVLQIHGGKMVICIDPLTFEQKDLDRFFELFPHRELTDEPVTAPFPRSDANEPRTEGRIDEDRRGSKALTVSP